MPRQSNGTGTFYERNGRFEYRVSVGIGMDGKAVRKTFYGHTKKECLKKYQDWLKGNKKGPPIEKVKTVGEWADRWLELYKKGKVAYGTYRNYEMYVNNHIKPALGRLKFEQVRPAHIEEFFLLKEELSDSAQHSLYVVLKAIFDTAIRNHLCLENPVEPRGKRAMEEQFTIQVFPLHEIESILSSDNAYAVYPQLLLYTGLRVGELLALKWTDIDLENDIIKISHAVAQAEGGGYEEKGTKSGKTRYIGIPPKLKVLLLSLPKRGLYLLLDREGKRMTPDQFKGIYKKFFIQTGLEYLSPHKCRHTYATYLIKGGAELRAVQTMLGHSKSEVTELYTHVDTGDIKNNVSKLAY